MTLKTEIFILKREKRAGDRSLDLSNTHTVTETVRAAVVQGDRVADA